MGLTTALYLQEELRNSTRIDVIAEDYEQITSHVAAGIFRVGTNYTGPTEAITRFFDFFSFYRASVVDEMLAIHGTYEK